MSNENDIIAHFSRQQQTSTLFLCLLFKMVLDSDRVPVEAYKVLERLGPRQLMSHVRTLCDFLVLEFSNCALGQYLSKCVNTMNAIIWQYHIVPLDRLMLCLALRTQEGSSEAQVCMFIIQLLLLRPIEFRNRVKEFVSENMPDHWNHNNWYEQHMAFHRKYPEKFSPESLVGGGGGGQSGHHQTLPIYFTNVCLRFLPVLDIIIHRFLEVHQVHKRLEMVLEQLGSLYKFHDHPITYLYNTLHYYEGRLRESPKLKRQLVAAVIGNSVKPKGWALSEEYLATPTEEITWTPKLSYYTALIRRLVLALRGVRVFPHGMEWRFSEFGNSGTHALHVTCVELMALPVLPDAAAENLFDVVIKGHCDIPANELGEYINAVALVLTWLPESYWLTVHHRIINLLQSPELSSSAAVSSIDIFSLMRLDLLQPCVRHSSPALTIALVHAFWHHSSLSQLGRIPQLMKEQIRVLLETEAQLVCLFQLVGPFLSRFSVDIARKVFDVTLELYHALAKVDEIVPEFVHQDAICDVLYHIKYMFTGDSIKPDLEGIIRGLRPDFQRRLRFITHLNLSNIQAGVSGPGTLNNSNNSACIVPCASVGLGAAGASSGASTSAPLAASGVSPAGNV
ncbi:Mediator complex subunit Med23 [Trinorchestia longiramus]|nr:Mediator complex subunit Med23 [Trinorchestia longiramus]